MSDKINSGLEHMCWFQQFNHRIGMMFPKITRMFFQVETAKQSSPRNGFYMSLGNTKLNPQAEWVEVKVSCEKQ